MKKVLLILTTTVLLQACGGGGSSPLAGPAVIPQFSVSSISNPSDSSSPVVAAVTFTIPKWAPQRWIGDGTAWHGSYDGWMFTDISADPNWFGVAKIAGQWRYIGSSDCILTLANGVAPPLDPRWLGCWDAGLWHPALYPSSFTDRYGFDPLAYIKTFVGGTSFTGSADGWRVPVVSNTQEVFGVVQIAGNWQIVVSNECPYDCLNAELYDASTFNSRFGFNPLADLP